MKTKFKMKSILLFALVLPLAFGLMACEEVEELEDLAGTVRITGSNGAVFYVGDTLTATYDGTEEVTLEWRRNDTFMNNGTQFTPTADQGGSYTVVAKADGYYPLTSTAVYVVSRNDFFGDWIMIGEDASPKVNFNEKLSVAVALFDLKDVNVDDGTDLSDFFKFTIESWTVVANSDEETNAEFPRGFTVRGTTSEQNGYLYGANTTAFNVYMNAARNSFVRTQFNGNAPGGTAPTDTAPSTIVIQRYYKPAP